MTTKEWLNFWLDERMRLRVKPHTQSIYRGVIDNHIMPELGGLELDAVTPDVLQIFMSGKLLRGNLRTGAPLSARSVNMIFAVVRNAFGCAVRFGHIRSNPCDLVVRARECSKPVSVLSAREQRLVETCAMKRGGAYIGIVIALHTGLRIGELLSLLWKDVDLRARIINVNKTVCRFRLNGVYVEHTDLPKSASSVRRIPVSSALASVLGKLRDSSGSEYVVSDGKGPLTVRAYQHRFERFLAGIGVRHIGFHSLRHTFATRGIECGVDVKTISELLGHKNTHVTMNKYLHSMAETKRRAVKLIDRTFYPPDI
ncbi:MAG TPA: site-specific integrase [Firmicutes bacterium]|nr:site-specific integrase [Bacillota bacterium]